MHLLINLPELTGYRKLSKNSNYLNYGSEGDYIQDNCVFSYLVLLYLDEGAESFPKSLKLSILTY